VHRLADREQRVELAFLKDQADTAAPLTVWVAGIDAEDRGIAGGAVPIALEDLDGRRLARAVGTEKAEDLARRYLEVDAAHGLVLAV
jgi:hypothetical protein